ncbi:glycoside hydrolase family 9 protein [Treponema sp. J25]|uniref:glycoside hydrolase family 9 protein n=1 Tax=Treponema sp. J25 TaxID=2094121 RepID=UPI001404BFB6|nr:glycoside hydrolase family 9 protein [Treponema sp. J25]
MKPVCGTSGSIIYQVGDGGADHAYWGPPELQTGTRPSYAGKNISCVLANEAAVFALSHITGIGGGDINTAKALYALAENAKSDADYTAANGFYNSWSGFYDELVWAAIWIYLADTNANKTYLQKAETYFANLNASDYKWTQCWDDKKYGAILKLAQITGKKVYVEWVERYLDWWMKGGGITYTPGGLPYLDSWGVLRYASATAFLAKIWADYPAVGTAAKKTTYKNFANSVINYILGNNPANMSLKFHREFIFVYGNLFNQPPNKGFVVFGEGDGLLPEESVHISDALFLLVPPGGFQLELLLFLPQAVNLVGHVVVVGPGGGPLQKLLLQFCQPFIDVGKGLICS